MTLERKIKLATLTIFLPLTLLGLMECSSKEKANEQAKAQAQQLLEKRNAAEDVYVYAYPLVLMSTTQDVMTNVEKPTAGKSPKAPINQVANFKSFPDDTFTDIVTPNADTLYSNAWLDLSDEPVVISTPASGKRYFVLPLMDAYTNVFFSGGTRTTGNAKATYLVVGPGWNGSVPSGMQKVQAPTNMVWMLGRYSCTTSADCKAANRLQNQIKVASLSQWNNKQKSPAGEVDDDIDMTTPPPKQVADMSGEEYFDLVAELLKDNPPSSDDQQIINQMAKIGIVPGQDLKWDKIPQTEREALNDAARIGHEKIMARAQELRTSGLDGGWIYNRNLGQYGDDYDRRAAVAIMGLGANLDQDALYQYTNVDQSGEPLSGANKYRIHFAKDEMPPVKAFWSVSLYDKDQHFTKNPIKRFAIGSRNSLKRNSDGSIDIYIQNQSPAKKLTANWLPAPKDQFSLVFRMYYPGETALNGTYKLPAVEKVNELPQVGSN